MEQQSLFTTLTAVMECCGFHIKVQTKRKKIVQFLAEIQFECAVCTAARVQLCAIFRIFFQLTVDERARHKILYNSTLLDGDSNAFSIIFMRKKCFLIVIVIFYLYITHIRRAVMIDTYNEMLWCD